MSIVLILFDPILSVTVSNIIELQILHIMPGDPQPNSSDTLQIN